MINVLFVITIHDKSGTILVEKRIFVKIISLLKFQNERSLY